MTNEGVYKDSVFRFNYDNGFAVAAAVTYGDARLNEAEEDPEIGQLKFVMKFWNNATQGVEFKELKTRPCKSEEFNLREG